MKEIKYVTVRLVRLQSWERKSHPLKQKSNPPSRFDSGILKNPSEGETNHGAQEADRLTEEMRTNAVSEWTVY